MVILDADLPHIPRVQEVNYRLRYALLCLALDGSLQIVFTKHDPVAQAYR